MYVESPIVRIGSTTRIVDLPAANPHGDENRANLLEVRTILLGEVDVRNCSETRGNPSFRIKVSSGIVDPILAGADRVTMQERPRKLNNVQMATLSLAVRPSTPARGLHQPTEE